MNMLLIRHGRSAHTPGNAWVNPSGLHRWRAAYDEAGIDPNDVPPASVTSAVARTDLIVSSDLRRAVESASRLAPGRPLITSALLRETPPGIPVLPLYLPVRMWDVLATTLWGYRIVRGRDASPAERQRAAAAAEWLLDLGARATLAVVTHGVFRRLLTSHLQKLGWQGPARRSYACWSVWTLQRR